MKKENQRALCLSLVLIVGFVLWTAVVCLVDVRVVGPNGSTVGLATINQFFHSLTGVHMNLYIITDWLSLVPMGFVVGFAILGLSQWIRRKRLGQVDYSLFVLGVFYVVVMAMYILFEVVIINYRPVLIDGRLEASYPSSTTMLVMCVMPTAMMQLNSRIKNKNRKRLMDLLMLSFIIFMVAGRLVCGVHWLSDIVGGALLSAGLVLLYSFAVRSKTEKTDYE